MTPKLLGAVLLFCAAGTICYQQTKRRKQEICWIEDLAAALEEMETAIRFRRMPMPELLRMQAERTCCGEKFNYIIQDMESGIPLQKAWVNSMQSIPLEEVRQAALSLELGGDTQRLTTNLQAVAQTLRQILCRRLAEKKQQQKTTLALTVSGFGLLVILLL